MATNSCNKFGQNCIQLTEKQSDVVGMVWSCVTLKHVYFPVSLVACPVIINVPPARIFQSRQAKASLDKQKGQLCCCKGFISWFCFYSFLLGLSFVLCSWL